MSDVPLNLVRDPVFDGCDRVLLREIIQTWNEINAARESFPATFVARVLRGDPLDMYPELLLLRACGKIERIATARLSGTGGGGAVS